MAGGKETPRQKMISLMYLVFIAMLALNMSKEVLSAFGNMNKKFETSNVATNGSNEDLFNTLQSKASDNPAQYGDSGKKGKQVKEATKKFYDYFEEIKKELTKNAQKDESGNLIYEAMDTSHDIDESWFIGDGLTEKGKEVIATLENYKEELSKILGDDKKFQLILESLKENLDTAPIKDKEGVTIPYLSYNFKGFPLIASVSKLSTIQNDALAAENKILNTFIGGAAIAAASMKNYTTIVIPEKSAFFEGEPVKGKIVLGRFDKSTVPTEVIVNGSKINLNTSLKDGQVHFSFGAGSVGEHDIKGNFIFKEDGKPIPIPILGNYTVVPRPNSATISADKMNVVYRGVKNPMTISFAGISADKVTAQAPGLRPAGKPGAYIMEPGQGSEVTINVTAKLPDGTPVSDRRIYRIKSIPSPVGAIAGDYGIVKGSKSRLDGAQVSAKLIEFDFEVNLVVTQFTLKVAGQAAVVVNGDRINQQCRNALLKAGRGDQVTISDIKTKLIGSDILLSRTAPVIFEIQ